MISRYVFRKLETGSQRTRRRWVLAYSAGLLFVLMGSLFGSGGQSVFWLGMFVAGVLLFVHSSFQLTRRYQLAEIANLPLASLDERQRQVRLRASELAYSFVVGLVSLLFFILFVASYLPWQLRLTSVDWSLITLTLYLFFSSLRLVLIAWLEPDPVQDDEPVPESKVVST